MQIENQISNLNSPNKTEVEQAIDYFEDFFYFDKEISDNNYVLVIKTLVDKILNPDDDYNKNFLFGTISSAMYSSDPKGCVSTKAYHEAILCMTKSNDPIFRLLLEDFTFIDELKNPILNYLERSKQSST
ncbi:hypothetical protein [Brumimicrobium mesophilum]|uniref:hypothetical protein n=1 Tax=Brumimicrobium mesophilum TaxID=392717 RepID=UPI000D1441FA|nr:hypothetical protein [Brumimicrobium mesophilum]